LHTSRSKDAVDTFMQGREQGVGGGWQGWGCINVRYRRGVAEVSQGSANHQQ